MWELRKHNVIKIILRVGHIEIYVLLFLVICKKLDESFSKKWGIYKYIESRYIQYVKVKIQDSIIGGILCEAIVFYSQKLCFRENDKRLEILEIYDTRPNADFKNKYLKNLSDKLLKNKISFYK